MITLHQIREAAEVIAGKAHHTPLILSETFSHMAGCQVYLKLENLQRTGSFKLRGAINRVASLTPQERGRGIIAASAGNHAQGVALAAQQEGVPCTIVMPEGASLPKVTATRGYGARVILKGRSYDQAQSHALKLGRQGGLIFIHAFDDPKVIAGQGTIGLELLEDLPEVEAVLVPLGGGGLIGGIAVAVKALKPDVRVIGVQARAATGAYISLQEGRRVQLEVRPTVADGVAIGGPGRHTFPLIQRFVDEVVLVGEEEIAGAMVLLLERAKLLVEGAGAVALASLMGGKVSLRDKKVAVVISGGNMDLNLLARVIQHGLAHAGRYLTLRLPLADRPGELAKLLSHIAGEGTNVLEVVHQRAGIHLPIGNVEVGLTLETIDGEHARRVTQALREAGYTLAEEVPYRTSGETEW